MNRWIMYASQNIPGNQSFRLTCHESLARCVESLDQFSRDIYADDVSAWLYVFDDESWYEARRYEDTGCPFDYPARLIERGPRGGWRVQSC